MLKTLTLAYSWAKSSNKAYFKVLNISGNLFNTVLKVKNRMTVWIQNGRKCICCYPCDCMADWELPLAALSSGM